MDESRVPTDRRPARRALAIGLALVGAGGCAPHWYLSFTEAEQARRAERAGDRPERTMLIFYKDHLDPNSGRMEDVLDTPQVKPLLNGKIRLLLVKEFPPNQRYMAQFDISVGPALVLVHPDGTYHAREGVMTPEQARDFLANSAPPGRHPRGDGATVTVPEYVWFSNYEEAVKAASRQNRKLFILYKWWLSAESNELITRLGSARIRNQVGDMVHCMLEWDFVPNRSYVARYGVTKVPALIVVHQDGSYHSQVGLASIDQIVQFISNARAPGRAPLR